METSLKTGFAQSCSRCPKNLSCPKFGGAAAPLAPPARTPMQIRSIYFCIETCIGENINWKSYNRIIKLSTSYIIVKYIRGGLVLERFLPRGVEGADILFPR